MDLLSSLPQLSTSDGDLYSIPGTPPSLYAPIKGDAFALRSDYAMQLILKKRHLLQSNRYSLGEDMVAPSRCTDSS